MPEALAARFLALRALTLLAGATLLLTCLADIAWLQ